MIWLARHGETAYNAERRFQGQGAVGLSERGREQAHALAEEAATQGFASLWASPLPRALETAQIVGERVGLTPVQDARLMETDTGDWTDRLFSEVEASDPQRFAAWRAGDLDFAFPGGESFADQQRRVVAALDDIERRGPHPVLVVFHRQAIRLAIEARQGRRVALDEVPNAALVAL